MKLFIYIHFYGNPKVVIFKLIIIIMKKKKNYLKLYKININSLIEPKYNFN